MATHPKILAWEVPWTEGPGSLQSTETQTVRNYKQLSMHARNIWTGMETYSRC